MRSSQMLKLANVINVPDMGVPAIRPAAQQPAGITHYLTGERQFSPGVKPSFMGAVGGTLGGAARTVLSPLLGLVSAGGKGTGRESGITGAAGSAVDALGNVIQGNWQGAGRSIGQLGRDINPFDARGAWSKSIQRHSGKGYEDFKRQFPRWWNYPGGFWESWGNQARMNAARGPSTAL